jgi:hypothetical protein
MSSQHLSPCSCVILLLTGALAACQSNLPALDSYPGTAPPRSPQVPAGMGQKPPTTPKATDVVIHIQCELARILNTVPASQIHENAVGVDERTMRDSSPEFARRLQSSSTLQSISNKLVEDHFVASVQLTLEVTDVQGFTPSLTFQNKVMGHHTGSLGAQVNGTQDRNITVSYAIDLAQLAQIKTNPCDDSSWESTQTGVQGDLGLADIVADGLISLNGSASTNLYSSTGPTPITASVTVSQSGSVELPYVPASPAVVGSPLPTSADSTSSGPSFSPLRIPLARKSLDLQALKGTIVFVPQSAYVQTQGSAYFNGVVGIDGEAYIASWTGTLLPINSVTASVPTTYFTLSGALTPVPDDSNLQVITGRWGLSPTVTLTGSIDKKTDGTYKPETLKLAGIIAPASASDYSRALAPIEVKLHDDGNDARVAVESAFKAAALAAAPGASPSKATSSTSSATASSGGTSFGSLVDFTLVWGLNGSPLFTWQHLVGFASGATPLGNFTHTGIDSMAITFVPACRTRLGNADKSIAGTFWDTLPVCDDLPSASQIGASIGYQNNQLMILRQPFSLPRAQ